jgi:hypothetical protein
MDKKNILLKIYAVKTYCPISRKWRSEQYKMLREYSIGKRE